MELNWDFMEACLTMFSKPWRREPISQIMCRRKMLEAVPSMETTLELGDVRSDPSSSAKSPQLALQGQPMTAIKDKAISSGISSVRSATSGSQSSATTLEFGPPAEVVASTITSVVPAVADLKVPKIPGLKKPKAPAPERSARVAEIVKGLHATFSPITEEGPPQDDAEPKQEAK